MNADLFGHTPPRAPFQDIRNQRGSVAETKATLCLQLAELVRVAPPSINAGSIKTVREWRMHCDKARKVLASSRSSINELTSAIAQMRSYK